LFVASFQQQQQQCKNFASLMEEEDCVNHDEHNVNHYYPRLFEPLDLGEDIGILPNRVLMGSMHTGLEGDSIPTWIKPLLRGNNSTSHSHSHHDDGLDAMAAYFHERAKNNLGLMVTGGIAPSREGWVAPFAAKLTTREEMEAHRVVTDAVHSVRIPVIHDRFTDVPSRICLQILHAGRYAMHPFAVSASATKSPISPFKARALSTRQAKETIQDFVRTALLAKEAGYDGVEVMGSEGYLIHQFLVTHTNQRTDEFGGDFGNRMKFAVDIVRGIRQAAGKDFMIIFRLSMMDLIKDGSDWKEIQLLAQAIEDAGATIINTGIGWHEARIPTIATLVPRGAFSFVTAKLRGSVGVPLCTTNRINGPRVAEDILEAEQADLVSMARPFLADPELLTKSKQGRADEINTCIGCNQACLDHTFLGKTASCLVNPRAGHELEFAPPTQVTQEETRKKIAVVGAGPAGLACATTAASLGHDVTLYDNASEIGGQFNMAKRVPGKEEFYETLRYFGVELKKRGVKVRLNHPISKATMRDNEERFDAWILATGVHPRTPPIPGIGHPKVLSYIDVLKHKVPVGERVAIIGAGGIGFDVAEYLLHHNDDEDESESKSNQHRIDEFFQQWGVDQQNDIRGGLKPNHQSANNDSSTNNNNNNNNNNRRIHLLQRKKGKLGAGLGKTTGWIHRATLAQSGRVEMIGNVSYEKVDENGNLHVKNGNTTRVLEVDNIILCAGQESNRDLLEHNNGGSGSGAGDVAAAGNVHTIGGAYKAGELDAKRAIDMGTRLAYKLTDPDNYSMKAPTSDEEIVLRLMAKWMK